MLKSSCPVCHSAQLDPIPEYKHAHLVKCKGCGMVFSNEQPEHEELIQFYSNGYDLTRYYSPITEKRYQELLKEFEAFRKEGRLLDIGCGYGFFLQTAREAGWETTGIEITDDAVKACTSKGLRMHHGTLQEAVFPNDHFDVIVLIESIEHLKNVEEVLEEIHRVLRPGGLVYLSTPNFNAINRYRLQEKYDIVQYPLHLSYFTPGTLKRFFESNGFNTQMIISSGISKTRYKTSTGQSNQEYVSETSDDEMLRYRIEKSAALKTAKKMANGILNALKLGESIKGYFVKS